MVSTNQFPNTGPRLGEVRVLTLNLWGRHEAWPDRRAVLIDGLRALWPDLIWQNYSHLCLSVCFTR
jgi:hypothetical protein